MKIKVTSKQIEQITGLKVNTLHYYIKSGAIIPDIDVSAGRGTKRLFSDMNLMEALIIQRLIETGVSKRRIVEGLERIRTAGERDKLSFSAIAHEQSGFLIFYLQDKTILHGFIKYNDPYLSQKIFKPAAIVLSLNFLAADYITKLHLAGYDVTDLADRLQSPKSTLLFTKK